MQQHSMFVSLIWLHLFCLTHSGNQGCLPPTMDIKNETLVLDTEDHTVMCPIVFFPMTDYKITWSRDGVRIPIEDNNLVFSFTYPYIKEGEYTCVVENACGKEESLPIIVKSTYRRKKVKTHGRPYAVIRIITLKEPCTWTRIAPFDDGESVIVTQSGLKMQSRFNQRLVVLDNDLYVKYMVEDDLESYFFCKDNIEEKKFELTGRIKNFKIFGLIPTFPRGQNIKIKLNTTEEFVPCFFFGRDYNKIMYYKNGMLVDVDTLHIDADKRIENISFSCIPAMNEKILFKFRQEFTVNFYEIPAISNELRSVNATRGEHVRFICNALQGFPNLRLEWFINSELFNKSTHTFGTIEGGILDIFNATDSLNVKCKIFNEFAAAARSVYLKIIESPEIYLDYKHLEISQNYFPSVKCEGRVDPMRDLRFTWLYDGKDAEINSKHYITQRENISIFLWILNTKDFENLDQSVSSLSCIVSDGFSSTEKSISVKFKNINCKRVSLWHIIWIPIALVCVFIILVMIVYIYRKKRNSSYTLRDTENMPFLANRTFVLPFGNPDNSSSILSINSDSEIEEDANTLLNNNY